MLGMPQSKSPWFRLSSKLAMPPPAQVSCHVMYVCMAVSIHVCKQARHAKLKGAYVGCRAEKLTHSYSCAERANSFGRRVDQRVRQALQQADFLPDHRADAGTWPPCFVLRSWSTACSNVRTCFLCIHVRQVSSSFDYVCKL